MNTEYFNFKHLLIHTVKVKPQQLRYQCYTEIISA